MNRGYTTTFYRKLIHNIISECPDIAIGTDVIVGFPGEDDRDFEKTTSILQELPFSYIHVFPYSKRPDTRASVLSNHLKNALKKQRTEIIRDISIKKKKEYISKQTGKTLDVLIEQRDKTNEFYEAISDNYVRTQVRAAGALQIGQRLLVKVSELSDSTLISTIGE
jgi:threonylcarbamoyladenosine tRNA methylthiotransferase MtaB